jgi:hypothetical protein
LRRQASASASLRASWPSALQDAGDCFDRGDVAERTNATVTQRSSARVDVARVLTLGARADADADAERLLGQVDDHQFVSLD